MAIESICSGCGQHLAVDDEFAGRRARCPKCGQIYVVPLPSSSPTSTSAPEGQVVPPDLPSGVHDEPQQDASSAQFWMRAPDGNEYGPVDRAKLTRWFVEGRVGPGYQIKLGESASWQPAELYRPNVSVSPGANPYADNPSQFAAFGGSAGPMANYPKTDQSGLVLAMGILSWVLCPIFGIVAWIMGQAALRDVQAGRMDPTNKGLVQVGYYLGMVNVILTSVCFGGYLVFIAIAVATNALS